MKIVKITCGLGNQMFQYSFYKVLYKLDKDVQTDISFYNTYMTHNGYELDNVFGIKENHFSSSIFHSSSLFFRILRKFFFIFNNIIIVTQKHSKYTPEVLELNGDVIYDGYWQTEKYFSSIRAELINVFKFPEMNEEKNIKLAKTIKEKNSVSLHIRRGDFIGNVDLENMAPVEYYQRAISYITKKVEKSVFIVFSDDIEWAKKELPLQNYEVNFVDWNFGKKSFRDMQLMSLCKHNIIPNSSFSWWGAWLNSNENKIVIAPEKWFTEACELNYDDIVPDSWVKIKNN